MSKVGQIRKYMYGTRSFVLVLSPPPTHTENYKKKVRQKLKTKRESNDFKNGFMSKII